jgi:hypothetical protein
MKKNSCILLSLICCANIYSQADEYQGKLVMLPNPCKEIPCLPGLVWGLETAENSYILTVDNQYCWASDHLSLDNTEYSMEDSVVISGITYSKCDVYNNIYIELEIENIVKTALQTVKDDIISVKTVDNHIAVYFTAESFPRIDIYTLSGERVYSGTLKNSPGYIDTAFLPKGVYILILQNKNLKNTVIQFIKQ